jgi:DNA-binding NtrC family response regulator
LRQRGDDLPLLIRHFLRRFGREQGRDVREAAPEALERLRAYPWPGNIRELQGVLKQALLRAGGNIILPAYLPQSLGAVASAPTAPSGKEPGIEEFLVRLRLGPHVREFYAEAHRNLDRLLLPRVLEHTGGSQHQAALILGIARQTLRLKLRDLGQSTPRAAEAEGNPG